MRAIHAADKWMWEQEAQAKARLTELIKKYLPGEEGPPRSAPPAAPFSPIVDPRRQDRLWAPSHEENLCPRGDPAADPNLFMELAPTTTTIGGQKVRSWHPNMLVGTSRRQFRRAAERIIRGDPAHPLAKLLDPGTLRLRPTTEAGTDEMDWLEDPRLVESGHVGSLKGGGPEMLIMMSAYKNRLLAARIEHPSFDASGQAPREAFNIGGIAIDPDLARDLLNRGVIDLQLYKSLLPITF